MSEPRSKQEILDLLRVERERWEGLVAELGQERLVQPVLPGGWAFKDLLAHLTAWHQDWLRLLEGVLQDRPPRPRKWPENMHYEQVNDLIFEASQPRPLDDILVEWRQEYARLLDLVARIPDAALFDSRQFEWLNGRSPADVAFDAYGHLHEEHWEPLQDWLAERGWR